MLIGRKYRHQISSAMYPPVDDEPLGFTNIPVIGMKVQDRKKIPCTSNNNLRALSFLFFTFMVSPMKNVESAMMP